MSRLFFTLALCLFSLLGFANNSEIKKSITGIIIDKETKQPLEFATVSIFENGTLIDGTITDADGKFSLEAKQGNYTLKAEYISYKAYETKIELRQPLDLGNIYLKVDIESLDEVEIIAEKSTVELKLDKKVFNVGKDILSLNGSLSEVLDNVPSVGVDIDGNVSLRGNANVAILINGKPSVLVSNLNQIPAQDIDRIEVITNPSARYQAAGTAGIINVILKKNKKVGLNGLVSMSNAIRADFRLNTNLNYKTGKFNFFSTVGYRFVDSRIVNHVDQSSIINGNAITLDQDVNEYRNYKSTNIYAGADYYINDKNTLTASYYKTLRRLNNSIRYDYDYFNDLQESDSTIVSKQGYYEPQDHNQIELGYVKTFEKEGKGLSVDFQYDFWDDNENENLNTQMINPILSEPVLSRTNNIESSKDFLVQIDFENPINDNESFETGLRAETRVITSDYKAEVLDGSMWQTFNDIENKLDYKEQIGAVYAQYANQANKFNYQLGLRVEFTKISITDQNNLFGDTKKYTNIFPTAHFSYKFSDETSTQLSYSRRISRPGFWYLNPFGGLAQINVQRQGNPDMDPALTNSLELTFLSRIGKLRINPSVYFQNTKDVFQFFTERNAEDVLITKPINLDYRNRIGFELSSTYDVNKWLGLSGEFNYFSFTQRGDFSNQNFDFDGDSWYTSIDSRIKLLSDITMQASFDYNGRTESVQEITKSSFELDLGVSKNFLNNKASITFNVYNVLDSDEQYLTRTGEGFNYQSYRKRLGPKFSLAFLYRFNQKSSTKTRRPGSSNRN